MMISSRSIFHSIDYRPSWFNSEITSIMLCSIQYYSSILTLEIGIPVLRQYKQQTTGIQKICSYQYSVLSTAGNSTQSTVHGICTSYSNVQTQQTAEPNTVLQYSTHATAALGSSNTCSTNSVHRKLKSVSGFGWRQVEHQHQHNKLLVVVCNYLQTSCRHHSCLGQHLSINDEIH